MMRETARQLWIDHKGLLLFLVLMVMFRSSLADWNVVPTESMKPTIVEGDRILINKVAYDLHLPFSNARIAHFSDPKRGDVVIFNSAISNQRLVKRVIGVPGDIISMDRNRVILNGQIADYTKVAENRTSVDLIERLDGIPYPIRVSKSVSRAASFDSVVVPEDHYLVLGDNRDNSADSRYIGFVPRDEVIGRSRQVVMSLNYDNYYLPRKDRFWKPL